MYRGLDPSYNASLFFSLLNWALILLKVFFLAFAFKLDSFSFAFMIFLELGLMNTFSCRKMQSDNGKLFIGGISWDTDEERLKDYFSTFGEVVEAVIMKDRTTGRARGFGFVVFADPSVADRVIKEKHNIDGRMVSIPCILLF